MTATSYRTPIPSSAELVCRYLLGLRHPDMAYLEAVEVYLGRVYGPGTGSRLSYLLEWLDPHRPLGAGAGNLTVTETTWTLTRTGAVAAERLLTPSPSAPKRRRYSRRVLLAMALLGAVDPSPAADSLSDAIAAHDLPPGSSPVPAESAVPAELVESAARLLDAAFDAHPRIASRVAMADGACSAQRCLAQLENQGIVRQVRNERVARVAGIVTRTHIDRLRAMVRNGDTVLSPLAAALLYRPVDRSPVSVRPGRQGPKPDAGIGRAILAAHLAHDDAVGAVAEQVVLRHPVHAFEPLRRHSLGAGRPGPGPKMATRRVDLTLWRPEDPPGHPSTLVEIERDKTPTDTHLRVRQHLEAAMAVSALGRRHLELCFVADSLSRSRIVATVASFRSQFHSAAAGLWATADVTVRAVPLRQARSAGLVAPAGASDWSADFCGRGDPAADQPPLTPLAMLGSRLTA